MRSLLFFLFIFFAADSSFSYAETKDCRSYITHGDIKYCVRERLDKEAPVKIEPRENSKKDDGRKLPSENDLKQNTEIVDPSAVDIHDLDGPLQMLRSRELIEMK